MNGVQVVNNTVSRGSVIFLVSSDLWTYEVRVKAKLGLYGCAHHSLAHPRLLLVVVVAAVDRRHD